MRCERPVCWLQPHQAQKEEVTAGTSLAHVDKSLYLAGLHGGLNRWLLAVTWTTICSPSVFIHSMANVARSYSLPVSAWSFRQPPWQRALESLCCMASNVCGKHPKPPNCNSLEVEPRVIHEVQSAHQRSIFHRLSSDNSVCGILSAVPVFRVSVGESS